MEWFEAVILGLLQGLTEFLPVSSSGHLEIGKEILGVETVDDLLFTTMVHAYSSGMYSSTLPFQSLLAFIIGLTYIFRTDDLILITSIPLAMSEAIEVP